MPVEWSDRFRSALTVTVAGLWAATFGVAGSGAGRLGDPWSPVWPLLAGVVGAVVFATPAVKVKLWLVAAFRGLSWMAAAGWVAWAYAAGVGDGTVWRGLGFGTLGFALASLGFAVPDAAPGIMPGAVTAVVRPHADWEARLATVGRAPGCTVAEQNKWKLGTGYDLLGECPPDGTSWHDLKEKERALSASLRLPRGCGVEIGPGDHSGAFTIKVATSDTLGEVRTYDDTSELSILGPIPFGRHRDSSIAAAVLRQSCVLVVSETGGGKTNFLHTVQAGLVRCPDALVWHIDLGGAGLALPWVSPWLDGDMERPVVDWVAPDLNEALILTRAAIAIIKQRRIAYRRLFKAADSDLLPVSHDLPEIVISIDETAEAAGLSANAELQQNIVRIIQLGRAVAVRVVLSGLRATATVLPTDAQRQIGVRAVFGVGDEAEIGHALGWRTKLDLGEAPYPGAGWWRDGTAGGIQVFRTPLTAKPSTIAAIAVACEVRRPELDAASLAGGDGSLAKAYAARWERTVPILTGGDGGGEDDRMVSATAGPSVAQSGGMTTGGGGGGSPGGYDADAVQRKINAAKAAQRLASMPPSYVEQQIAQLDEWIEDERAGGGVDVAPGPGPALTPRPDEPNRDQGRRLALALLRAAGPEGMTGAALLAGIRELGFTESDATLYRWITEWKVSGQRYAHPDHSRGA